MNLSENAMIVNLSIGNWTARKYDRKVSDKAAEMYEADGDAGRYNKLLVSKKAVKKVQSVVSQAYLYNYQQTLPWGDDGMRILPAKNYWKYMEGLRDIKKNWEEVTEEFIQKYPELVEEAKARLKGMFRYDVYPTVIQLRTKFYFRVDVIPAPDPKDFRVALSATETEKIRAAMEQRLKETTDTAMKDLWSRLHTVVSKMAVKLSDPEEVFHKTLVGNIVELVDLLPRLNVTDDPVLEAKRREVEQKLCHLDPQELRDNKQLRSNVAAEAKRIADMMKGYTS